MNSPRVLFVVSELYPLVKTGGLGDVAAALPPALRRAGVDVRLLVPGYRAIMEAAPHGPTLWSICSSPTNAPCPVTSSRRYFWPAGSWLPPRATPLSRPQKLTLC